MNKSTKKPNPRHYGVIGSDSVVLAYPAAEVERYIAELEQRAEAAEAKLAELVPDEKPDLPDNHSDTEWRGMCDGWNACRAAILRNIEGAK